MEKQRVTKTRLTVNGDRYPVYRFHTLVIGSGAASLKAADRLHQYGVTDIAIVTDNFKGGTSRNTGSDKQTYYKLSMSTPEPDSPYAMAEALFQGGSMHGDIALIEAAGSAEAFFHLVNIGVPFPHNRYGGYTGYKTDHDPLQRGTSIGPFTSKVMVERLAEEVRRRRIPIFDGHEVISLLSDGARVYGALAVDYGRLEEPDRGFTVFLAENTVFGTGGPGGLYRDSVYPEVHIGGIGLALEAGAEAYNLQESQFGLASTGHRWNVSGSYQQVVPRYVSTDPDGGNEKEFLNEYFPSLKILSTAIFLKGYQWPFDSSRLDNYGSSLIDILVYNETVLKGRRVFLDFTANPSAPETGGTEFSPEQAEAVVYDYLINSGALQKLPIDRLAAMNSAAVEHYREHGIDLRRDMLEIAVCAQHNNGGLAVDCWWESTNLSRLFPAGEAAGTHGVKRPGGSALNSGQVGAARAAQRIAFGYSRKENDGGRHRAWEKKAIRAGEETIDKFIRLAERILAGGGGIDPKAYRKNIQDRMTRCAGHIRSSEGLAQAIEEAERQHEGFDNQDVSTPKNLAYALRNRHLRIAETAYLQTALFYIEAGGGSRGSFLVLDPEGKEILPDLGREWGYKGENTSLRNRLTVTSFDGCGKPVCRLENRRPIPSEEFWFERVWKEYRNGSVFGKIEEIDT